MNQPGGQGPSTANESRIISDIHELFELYGPTFVDLVVGRRYDIVAFADAVLAVDAY